MIQELWKDVKGYEGYYKVSNIGRVRSVERYINHSSGSGKFLKKGKIRNQRPDKDGYMLITLHKDNKRKTFRCHRLVAEVFIPNPENKPEVNHIDGIKTNNQISNLEWVTTSENQIHARKIGLR